MSKKGKPIPVRFEEVESAAIKEVSRQSGLKDAEVVRRAVRFFYREAQDIGVGKLLEQTAAPLELLPLPGEAKWTGLRAAEEPPKKKAQ